jgi:hypothetical protein
MGGRITVILRVEAKNTTPGEVDGQSAIRMRVSFFVYDR